MEKCTRCGASPEHRHDVATGRNLIVCPECKSRGEASLSERRAMASWYLVNDDSLPAHSCQNGGLPRFLQQDGLWGAVCQGCGLSVIGYRTLEGAIAAWMREIRAQPRKR